MEEPQPLPQILAPCGGGRRSCGDSNSPEFEFWMVRNPSFPPPNLLTADELFSGGLLLPLHQVNLSSEAPASPPREAEASGTDRRPETESTASESAEFSVASALTSSKRWRDIFRKNDRKNGDDAGAKEKNNNVKERRREKKNGVGGSGASPAELNINIWPFARSRSAGNGGTRPRAAAATRKVSSAPCSRSNSRGESKSRKWPSSPARAGVHLGRSSPVWQARRCIGGGEGRSSGAASAVSAEKVLKREGIDGRRRVPVAGGSKARVLSLNVPVCMGYRQHFSCGAGGVAGAATGGSRSGGAAAGDGARGSNLFRSLFTKKVYIDRFEITTRI